MMCVSQLVAADLDILDSHGDIVCGIFRIGKGFQANFSFAQSSMKCLIS
jgi:hypothetical protein